ncbi:3-carboxymuconate cyclase-like protein [Caballeronia sordidicola]|uniref:3-carboxymuconate cyclase-like protein n=1 Tax=Caballeronia sordidicola TaxID=196367 RepID=A0A158EXN9_CABSO|nr:lactonase family protein [Caballeronia sordidicola]SAL12306.1 3-carboxymuconate cyclase-like protein [Caballeronia sordidicola]
MHSVFTSFSPRSARTQTSCRGPRFLTRNFAASVAVGLSLASAQAMAQDAGTAPGASANPSGAANSSVYDLLVGTYTGSGKSQGIYVYRFDTANGTITQLTSAQAVNPSYLVVSRDRQHVYAVNELPGDNGPASQRGGISAFRFDPASGQLIFVNRVSSDGNDPAYLALSPDGRYLLTANYSVASNPGGSFAVFPLEGERVLPSVLTVHHDGNGPVTGRQDNSHVHSTVFSPDGRYLFAQDLGADKLYSYRYTPDGTRGLFGPTESRYTLVKPGSGPRHMVFDEAGKHAYVTTEMNASVLVYDYDDGKLTLKQTLPMTTPGFKGKIGGGAIHFSPDGRFLYATNRGDANEILTYAVDASNGHLKLLNRRSTMGKTPREFAIDPTGRWLIVGNQDSDSVYFFRRDPQTGELASDPKKLEIGSPVDFKFVSPS